MTLAPQTGAPSAHLLVVDDEPNILELLSVSLRFAGFEVARRLRTTGSTSPSCSSPLATPPRTSSPG